MSANSFGVKALADASVKHAFFLRASLFRRVYIWTPASWGAAKEKQTTRKYRSFQLYNIHIISSINQPIKNKIGFNYIIN